MVLGGVAVGVGFIGMLALVAAALSLNSTLRVRPGCALGL